MSCLDAARLARAATRGPGEELDEPHLRECLVCRRKVEVDRTLRAKLRALPAPTLTVAHRHSLAAELLARAQLEPARRPRTVPMARVVAGTLAAAAAVLAVVAWPAPAPAPSTFQPVTLAADTTRDDLAVRSTSVAFEAPSLRTAASSATSTPTANEAVGPPHGPGWRTRDQHAVVGAERSATRSHVEHDGLWQTDAATLSLRALRDGWIALRDGRNAEAMQLFDRVRDPIAGEEAAYWAAVAARRANDASADARVAKFREMFPASSFVFHDR